MAVTFNDLSPRSQTPLLTSQRGLLLMVFCVLCGFTSFILCLAAEATRSEATWLQLIHGRAGKMNQCYYNGSGRTPLTFAVFAFFVLAIAMLTEHAFILITINSPKPPALILSTTVDFSTSHSRASSVTWKACFLFVTTWISFAIAEVLLMVGIGIECGHLMDWKRLRPNCIVVRQGVFAAAGVFGLITVFLAAGLYMTALAAQRLHQDEQGTERREVPGTSLPDNQVSGDHHLHQNPQTAQDEQGTERREVPGTSLPDNQVSGDHHLNQNPQTAQDEQGTERREVPGTSLPDNQVSGDHHLNQNPQTAQDEQGTERREVPGTSLPDNQENLPSDHHPHQNPQAVQAKTTSPDKTSTSM